MSCSIATSKTRNWHVQYVLRLYPGFELPTTYHFFSQLHYQVCRPARMPAFMPCQPALSPLATRENPWSFSSLSSTSRRLTAGAATSRSSPLTSIRATCMEILSITSCLVSHVCLVEALRPAHRRERGLERMLDGFF